MYRIGGSTKKYWYLSEADEKNPGGDGDIDYYKNTDDGQKHKKHAPLRGWITCAGAGKNLAGKEPPPMLQVYFENIPPHPLFIPQ